MSWTHIARASLTTLLAAAFALLLLTASAQAAATATVSFSADPTVDKPVTVTVSGSTSAARRLYVTIQRSATCGARVFEGEGDASLGELYRDVSGTFSETYSFTPASTAPYALCAYVTTHQVDAPDVLARGAVTARQAKAQAEVAVSADPTVDKPVTVTVTGSSEVARRLYVTIQRSATCGARVFEGEGDASLGELYRDVSGTFSETYSFTPASTAPYVLCAYVTTHQVDAPDVLARGAVTARQAKAQAEVAVSADPTVGKPATVTVTGSSEVARRLYVTIQRSATCGATVFGAEGARSLGNLYQDVNGPFSATYSFTPETAAPYVLCAYVTTHQVDAPDALVGVAVSPRALRVSALLTAAPDAAATRPFTFTVAGSSELTGKLYVRWALSENGKKPADCGTSVYGPAFVAGGSLDVRPVTGDYRETYTLTPEDEGAIRLCAYVLPAAGDPGIAGAVSVADVTVGTPIDPPVLVGPDHGATGNLLNPRFTWRTVADTEDTLLLARVARDGTIGTPVRFTATAYSGGDLTQEPGNEEDGDEEKGGDIDDIATYGNNGEVTTLKLDHGLVPGRYAWAVLREDGVHSSRLSDERTFDVQGPPLTRLDVSDRRWSGTRSWNPGETEIRIGVTAYAQVTLRLSRRGHTAVRRFAPGKSTTQRMIVAWSCTKPGGTYRYTVTATDQFGTRKTRSGSFRPVTSAQCSSMRRAESARRRARDAAARRREAARQRAEERAQATRIARYKRNCRKLGGTPVWLDGDGVQTLYCRGPLGGLIYVPW